MDATACLWRADALHGTLDIIGGVADMCMGTAVKSAMEVPIWLG